MISNRKCAGPLSEKLACVQLQSGGDAAMEKAGNVPAFTTCYDFGGCASLTAAPQVEIQLGFPCGPHRAHLENWYIFRRLGEMIKFPYEFPVAEDVFRDFRAT
jgi:hypothetical protein